MLWLAWYEKILPDILFNIPTIPDVAITFDEGEIMQHNYNRVTLYDNVQFCERSILNT
jgi:hypothetical protein